MTKEAYREELAAAHARIAQLEEQLADASSSTDPKIKKLLESRAVIVRTSDPKRMRNFALGTIGAFTLVFGLIGLISWAAAGALPNEAGMVGGIGGLGLFIGLLIATLNRLIAPGASRRQLEQVDQEIAEARRIAKLESEVAEMRRVRVRTEPAAQVEEEEEQEDVNEEARARR